MSLLKRTGESPRGFSPTQRTTENSGMLAAGEKVFPGKSILTGYTIPNDQP